MIRESEYRKVGKNELKVPEEMLDGAIALSVTTSFSVEVIKPYNFLYSIWKPSHFYTGLEIHSGNISWRSFRLNTSLFTVAKMIYKESELCVDIYSNRKLTKDELNQLKEWIVRSYGLQEFYTVPDEVADKNEYVKSFWETFKGTRISCPESFFEISIISLLLQNTTIARTTSMFHNLIKHYGYLVYFEDKALFSFYLPEELMSVTETELREECRLGYRAKYIKNYASFFSNYSDNDLRKLNKDVLLKLLEGIKGVGIYTANVIVSSALRDTQTIAFDSWNRKILANRLYNIECDTADNLKLRILNDFGSYAGIIALYVIENEYKENPVVPLLGDI